MGYLLAIDQGTSATKAVLFDTEGRLVARADTPLRQFYPQPGWVEHDPQEIFESLCRAVERVLDEKGIATSEILGLSISNQRETVILWDRITGKPVMRAIVWQCQRAEALTAGLEHDGYSGMVQKKTGLRLSPYFSAAKAMWIVKNIPEARLLMEQQRLLFGTVDSYLIWRLTKGRVHATDFSNASRTQLFNIHSLSWDDELLHLFGLDRSMMPTVLDSNAHFGFIDSSLFGTEIPIAGVLGDSHAAFFAQNCSKSGMAKATFGTGSSVMMHVGSSPIEEVRTIVSSIGYAIDGEVTYVLEGNINCTGATIKWLVDDLGLLDSSREAQSIASSVDDTLGVYMVPAFVGLGAPYWNSNARACICNVSRGVKRAHIVRAAEESIAYQIADVVFAMEQESGIPLRQLRVDGGPTNDTFLMQFQSDILGVDVIRSTIEELSAAGAMYMGILGLGLCSSIDELAQLGCKGTTFTFRHDDQWRKSLYAGWKKSVRQVLSASED